MVYFIKTLLALFFLAWLGFGAWLVFKYAALFGPHPDDPAESPGARSFGVAHVIAFWTGFFVLAFYFLFFK